MQINATSATDNEEIQTSRQYAQSTCVAKAIHRNAEADTSIIFTERWAATKHKYRLQNRRLTENNGDNTRPILYSMKNHSVIQIIRDLHFPPTMVEWKIFDNNVPICEK